MSPIVPNTELLGSQENTDKRASWPKAVKFESFFFLLRENLLKSSDIMICIGNVHHVLKANCYFHVGMKLFHPFLQVIYIYSAIAETVLCCIVVMNRTSSVPDVKDVLDGSMNINVSDDS